MPEVFRNAVRAINLTDSGRPWLTDAQLDDLRDQLLRQPNRTLLEANEAVQQLIFKAQVDVNEVTGEKIRWCSLIDFDHPANNRFSHQPVSHRHAGGVKKCIIPDIVLFVNGMPLAVVECESAAPPAPTPCTRPLSSCCATATGAGIPWQPACAKASRACFISNLLLIRTCGERADFGTITPGRRGIFRLEGNLAGSAADFTPPLGMERDQEHLVQAAGAARTF